MDEQLGEQRQGYIVASSSRRNCYTAPMNDMADPSSEAFWRTQLPPDGPNFVVLRRCGADAQQSKGLLINTGMNTKIGSGQVDKMLQMLGSAVTSIAAPLPTICCVCCTQPPAQHVVDAFEQQQLGAVSAAVTEINRSVLPRGITATVLFFGTLKSILIEATPGSPNWTGAAPPISAEELKLADLQSKVLHGDAVDNESLETAFADAVKQIDEDNEKKQAAYLAANPQSAAYFQLLSMMEGGQPQVVSTQPAMMSLGVAGVGAAGAAAGQKAGMLAAMSAPPAYTNPYAEDATPDDPFAMHPFLTSVPEQGGRPQLNLGMNNFGPQKSMIVQAPTGTMMSVAIPEGAVPGDQVIILPPLGGEMVMCVLASTVNAEDQTSIGIDTNGDGQADLFRKAVLIDTDGDGVFDTAQFQ